MTQVLQGALPVPQTHPCVLPNKPGIWSGGVGLDPATQGLIPSLLPANSFLQPPYLSPLVSAKLCPLQLLILLHITAPWPWDCSSGCPQPGDCAGHSMAWHWGRSTGLMSRDFPANYRGERGNEEENKLL